MAALLCCSLSFSQEADDEGNTFLLIPRLEVNPYAALSSDGYSGFDMSNSSLYTLFEGSLGDSPFSYSVEGHWLSTDPASLYSNTLRSDALNWLDWANITYAPNNFYLTLGKEMLAIGSLEEDAYDYDQHYNLCSTMWNYLQVYHWGAKAGWVSDDEATDLGFQVQTSPYGSKPFKSKLFSYSALLRGEYGSFTTLTSVNALGCGEGSYVGVFATGNQLSLGDFELGLDLVFRGYDFDFSEASVVGAVSWIPSDKLTLKLKGGVESIREGCPDVFGYNPALEGESPHDFYVPASLALCRQKHGSYVFGGLNLNYYPVENLRLHAVVAANNWANSLSFNIGALYYLDLVNLFK